MPVQVNAGGLKSRFNGGNIAKARYVAANQAMLNMNKYVPYSGETGKQNHLRDTSHVTSDGSTIIWNTKYATSQFYGIVHGHQVKNYTTPGTSKRWDKRMTGNKQDMREVSDAFKNTLLKG
ncbi:minor capsid protein [uncultured Weissella sp.]|uniref:minor capsid protein n=1 Tax=uncultured Weissella sp. TaxID=253243 RepID=UPI0027DAB795|nr:minor capsid protein [uncultured Weissella sp.]